MLGARTPIRLEGFPPLGTTEGILGRSPQYWPAFWQDGRATGKRQAPPRAARLRLGRFWRETNPITKLPEEAQRFVPVLTEQRLRPAGSFVIDDESDRPVAGPYRVQHLVAGRTRIIPKICRSEADAMPHCRCFVPWSHRQRKDRLMTAILANRWDRARNQSGEARARGLIRPPTRTPAGVSTSW